MQKNALDYFDNIVVAFSGGKDSTACLLWALDHFDHSKIRAVFQDSGVENPETADYINFLSNRLIPIDNIPIKSFWDWLREIGRWPGIKLRWCTRRLKTDPMIKYLKEISKPIVIFGMRGLESNSRSKYHALEYDPLFKCCRFHPIINWDERTVYNYIMMHNIPINPAYNYASRVGCWCCPSSRIRDIVRFAKIHPDVMTEAVRIEAEVGHTWNFETSLAQIAKIAKQQLMMELKTDSRIEYYEKYRIDSNTKFVFPEVSLEEIEQILASKSPRGISETTIEKYEQSAWDMR